MTPSFSLVASGLRIRATSAASYGGDSIPPDWQSLLQMMESYRASNDSPSIPASSFMASAGD